MIVIACHLQRGIGIAPATESTQSLSRDPPPSCDVIQLFCTGKRMRMPSEAVPAGHDEGVRTFFEIPKDGYVGRPELWEINQRMLLHDGLDPTRCNNMLPNRLHFE